jgi:hypothetical protein
MEECDLSDGCAQAETRTGFASNMMQYMMTVLTAVMNYMSLVLTFGNMRDYYNREWRKSVSKNVRGVKRAARQTFRKVFGTKKQRKAHNKYEESAKYITDKMLSDSSETDSDHDQLPKTESFFSFSVDSTNASTTSTYQGPSDDYRRL